MPGYRYRRVTHELRRRGHVVNHKRVARVMKARGLGIKPRRRFVRTTDSKHDSPIFPKLYRNVIPTLPNVVGSPQGHARSRTARVHELAGNLFRNAQAESFMKTLK